VSGIEREKKKKKVKGRKGEQCLRSRPLVRGFAAVFFRGEAEKQLQKPMHSLGQSFQLALVAVLSFVVLGAERLPGSPYPFSTPPVLLFAINDSYQDSTLLFQDLSHRRIIFFQTSFT
jgi:hypothetical protein